MINDGNITTDALSERKFAFGGTRDFLSEQRRIFNVFEKRSIRFTRYSYSAEINIGFQTFVHSLGQIVLLQSTHGLMENLVS